MDIKIDNSAFNVEHFKSFSLQEFINHELPSVPDSYGERKEAFLKTAYAAIQKAAKGDEKPAEKKPARPEGKAKASPMGSK